jgi:hypothetical protein
MQIRANKPNYKRYDNLKTASIYHRFFISLTDDAHNSFQFFLE